jgi:transcriptional regulator with XRE-family HTH domain
MLAEVLREARRKRGCSTLHLCKRSGVSRWVILLIEDESSSYVPSEGNTALLAEALRVPVGSLLAERDAWSSGCGTERTRQRRRSPEE